MVSDKYTGCGWTGGSTYSDLIRREAAKRVTAKRAARLEQKKTELESRRRINAYNAWKAEDDWLKTLANEAKPKCPRTKSAMVALVAFKRYHLGTIGKEENLDCDITDLITNLFHLCNEKGLDVAKIKERCFQHFTAETTKSNRGC